MLIGLTVIGALTLLGQSVHELWHTITTSMPR
jgi:Flp pilus assembly pilin Flp